MDIIKHANIIYVREIHPIGGVETYVYELVKKYKDYDIAVVCKNINYEQKLRIKKYCKVYTHTNQLIECEVAIINYDTSIIDFITKDIWKENLKPNDKRGIYQGIHADYTHPSQGQLPQDPRIKQYLAITEDVLNNFYKLSKSKNVILCRNPYTLEKDTKPLILVAPTRLTEEKGGDLMLEITKALDYLNVNYLFFVLTTAQYLSQPIFNNKNVIYIKNRLDVGSFLCLADWVILPSKCEGDSYTIKEALYRGIPIVARHLKYFDEYDIQDGKNALFINENNVMEVAKKMLSPLSFKFKSIEDGYKNILYESKSYYEEELNMKVKVECVSQYTDLELHTDVTPNEDDKNKYRIISKERADEIIEKTNGAIKILEEIKEEKKEKAVKTTTKKEKAVK